MGGKIVMNFRYIVYSVVCLLLLSACTGNQSTERKITSFSFTDQNEKLFGTDDLTGSVWIASFIFANCETVCPPMMVEMASLQEKMKEEALEVEFVSFTVDPHIDTPAVLKEYVQQFTNNETNWHMLTGYTQKEIEQFARDQFQTIVQKPKTSRQVIHGTNFYLVDDRGYVLNEYNYTEESHVEEIIKKVKEVYK